MRILLSSTYFSGHLLPLLSYARALKHRGHEVLVSAPASVHATLEEAGFAHATVDPVPKDEMAIVWARLDAANAQDALSIGIRDAFLGLAAKYALPKLQATITEWRPDVVLRDSFEFAAAHAAERAAIPHARVAVHSTKHEASLFPFLLEKIDDFRRAAGLAPDGGAALRAEPIFTAFPALIDGSGEHEGWPTPFRARERYVPASRPVTPPAWAPLDGASLIYITFGTVSGSSKKAKATYRAALAAVAGLPVRALLTTGSVMKRDELGAIPDNVWIETFVPQNDVFAYASAVVCHGGSGTLLGAFAAGLPVVVAPIFADQPRNARAVAAAGLGVAIFERDPQALRAAIISILADGTVRANVRRLAAEMAEMPTMEDGADAVAALASTSRRVSPK